MSKKTAAHAGVKATVWQQLRKVGPLRLGLGGVALAGVGAAATSAGWTGNIIFNENPAKATAFVLEGSTAPAAACTSVSAWKGTNDASASNGSVTLNLTDFSSLEPGANGAAATFTQHLWVRNAATSSKNASVALSDVSVSGAVFGNTSPGASGTAHATITSGTSATFTGTTGGPTVAVALTGADKTLQPSTTSAATDGCVDVAITITTPANWAYSYQGTSGTLAVTVQGQSTDTARS